MFVCLLVATVAAWFLKFDSASMGLCAVFARPTSYHLELAGTEKSETRRCDRLLPTSHKELDFFEGEFWVEIWEPPHRATGCFSGRNF